MKKLIFCDLNKSLTKKVETLFKKYNCNNKWNLELQAINWDIFETQKNLWGKIVTASNPMFTFGWWLDWLIKDKFPEEIKEAKEFTVTDNLFFTITVDKNIKATKEIVKRALIWIFVHSNHYNLIFSWLWVSIWWLPIKDFILILEQILNADLRYANLRSANLSSANLSSADLSSANLRSANLRSADLSSANLSSADLSYANLRSAENLDTVLYNELTSFFALQCPEEWEFIWRKKCKDNYIVKLLITKNALRSSATSRKCRASEVKTLEIFNNKWDNIKSIESNYDSKIKYVKWKITTPLNWFDKDRWNECSSWIHFFLTRKEAELYN